MYLVVIPFESIVDGLLVVPYDKFLDEKKIRYTRLDDGRCLVPRLTELQKYFSQSIGSIYELKDIVERYPQESLRLYRIFLLNLLQQVDNSARVLYLKENLEWGFSEAIFKVHTSVDRSTLYRITTSQVKNAKLISLKSFCSETKIERLVYEVKHKRIFNPYKLIENEPLEVVSNFRVCVYYSDDFRYETEILVKKINEISFLKGKIEGPFRILNNDIESLVEVVNRHKRDKDRVNVLILVTEKLSNKLYGLLKVKSLRNINNVTVSCLQLIDGKKLRNILSNKKSFSFFVSNILAAIVFKTGGQPYSLSTSKIEWDGELEKTVIVGIAMGRLDGFMRCTAVLMFGYGRVVASLDHDFQISPSAEFSSEEIDKFVDKILKIVKKLVSEREINNLVILRTRKFKKQEIEKFFKVIENKLSHRLIEFLDSNKTNIYLISYFDEKNVTIPCSYRDEIGCFYHFERKLKDNQFAGIIFYKYNHKLFTCPVCLSYVYTNVAGEPKSMFPLVLYEILRRCDFTSVAVHRKVPAPLSYARRAIKWFRYYRTLKEEELLKYSTV